MFVEEKPKSTYDTKFCPFFSCSYCKDYLKSQYNFFGKIFLLRSLSRYSTLFNPRANGAKRRSGRKPGRGLLIPLCDSGIQSRCSWWDGSMGGHDVILTLISKLWRTMISNRFNWPTRLFCFCQSHDTTLTVISRFAK